MARLTGISQNLNAFLDMISISEGTKGIGDDGYNVLVGGTTFHDYSKHPNILVNLGHGLKSTAAGRYQILARYAAFYQAKLNLHDFFPESQDMIAIQYIKEKNALLDIEGGRISRAIEKCSPVWASFTGAHYGQHENSMAFLLDAFKDMRSA